MRLVPRPAESMHRNHHGASAEQHRAPADEYQGDGRTIVSHGDRHLTVTSRFMARVLAATPRRAIGKPKSLLDSAETVLGPATGIVLLSVAFGREQAAVELMQTAIYAAAGVAVFVVVAMIRILTAAYQLHNVKREST